MPILRTTHGVIHYTFPSSETAPEHDGGPLTETDVLRMDADNGDFDQLFVTVGFGGVEHPAEIFINPRVDHAVAVAYLATATSCVVTIGRVNNAEPCY